MTAMTWKPIHKRPSSTSPPNLIDYERTRRDFTWDRAWDGLSVPEPGTALNIAYEAVDRHAAGPLANKDALRCHGKDGWVHSLTYADLKDRTNRFANLLRGLGVGRTERVFSLLGRGPELFITALGTLKNACVFAPLFPAFGPEPIRDRIVLGDGAVLVTTPELYRRKIVPIRESLPSLRHVLLVTEDSAPKERIEGTLDLGELLDAASPAFIWPKPPYDMALLHFTSGTTGKPKGAIHVHEAVLAHHVTSAYALDLHHDDIFWCTADPGWVTGTSYGIIAPLTHGATLIVDAGDFDAQRWYRILEDERVTVWYTAPTALRMLMRQPDLPARFDLSALRFIASVGEPLNPEVVVWGQETLGLPVHDNWWQTETGAIMIGNFASMDIRPGSMGRPLPGIEAGILARDEEGELVLRDGEPVEVTEPDTVGELALRPGWPSMFKTYLHARDRYEKSFVGKAERREASRCAGGGGAAPDGGWYRTGDLARRDADGYYWFVGRGDDVIKSSGHLVGPFEVESAMMEHPAVVEAGVIGKPDKIAGARVKAFVTLAPGREPSEDLRLELLAFGRRRLGAVAPKEIAFDDHLPHTRSGKVMRRLLKARELGLPEGDLSTLERSA